MTGNHPTLIPFASGRLTADLGHQLVYAQEGGFQHLTPHRFEVLDILTRHLGDIVLIDDLIDETAPNLRGNPERFMQRARIGNYISGLRKTFDQLVPGTGSVEHGVLQTEFSKGFWLAEHWHPVASSTEHQSTN